LKKFFTQFSFPGGIGSHRTPETPGSIHEGGELAILSDSKASTGSGPGGVGDRIEKCLQLGAKGRTKTVHKEMEMV
jgi:hypothetical protein